ncbi:ComF family protein [Brochothrix campestris]|uniref:Amidophosphoribosyltransferase n=1 Tax=Brochothrix campestris FSL F6-1037 TaxID=1265861 RepID=W7CTK9_9LIST|nr:phosphoribosyltransferase family protein [Brochothrix campestris]EUJ40035.1 amidophosphoribosyltransferase [Brochothrix campestris FSL F6-1037]
MLCILCDAPLLTATWCLFSRTTQPCRDCLGQFERVDQTDVMQMQQAQRELQLRHGRLLLIQPLFKYNQAAADFMLRYKYSGDWLLSFCFSHELRTLLRQPKAITIVPIPLSDYRQRGFAQVEALLNAARIQYAPVLRTDNQHRQASKTRLERLLSPPAFTIQEPDDLGKVVLFDDVSTTGATLYAACRCLEEVGVEVCGAYVLFAVQEKGVEYV